MTKRSPENTSASVESNPLAALVEYSGPGAIERSERRGQEQLLASDVLPVRVRPNDAAFEALGFTFGVVPEGDPQ